MARALLIAAALAVALVPPPRCFAEEAPRRRGELSSNFPFSIEADELSYEPDRELYEASGHVRIERTDGGWLTADWVAFSARTNIGVATGNVVIQDGPDRIEAEFAAVDLVSLVALATDASLDSGESGFIIEGDSIQKTGVNTYRIENGTFTTCRCPEGEDGGKACRPWELDLANADVRVGGYAVAEGVKFRIRDVPVLYTPYLILPVKTKRQTGFLFPAYGSSNRSGQGFELPFFWAVRENLNLTFNPTFISKRGFKNGLEFEYLFGERARGWGGASILAGDDEVDEGQVTPFSDNRWAAWLDHYQPLAPAVQFGLRLNEISDNDYVLDFDDLPAETRNARFLESTGWLSAARRGAYGAIELAKLDDLQSPENLDRDAFLLHRLPDVHLSSLPRRLGPLPIRGGIDMRYTYFYQQEDTRVLDGFSAINQQFFDTGTDGTFDAQEPDSAGIFDGADNHGDNNNGFNSAPQGNGLFEEGELLADHGHRVDLYPRLSLARRVGWVETLSEVGFRETLYYTDHDGSERREIWTGRWDARMRFQRRGELWGSSVRHLLEPKIGFAFVSTPGQRNNPLLIPRGAVRMNRLIDRDIRVLTRDPTDRVREERVLQLALTNRLYAERATEDGRRTSQEIGKLRIGGGYDFEDGRAENVYLSGRLSSYGNLDLGLELGVDPKKARMDEAAAAASWRGEGGHELDISYRFLREFSNSFENFNVSDDVFDDFDSDFDRISQFSFSGRWVVSSRWEVFGDGYVSLENSSNGAGLIGFLFRSRCNCWELAMSLEQQSRPVDTRFGIKLNLMGFGRSLGTSY